MRSSVFLASVAMATGVFGATVTVVAPQEGAAKSVTVANQQSATLDEGKSAALKAAPNTGWVFGGWYAAYDAVTGEFSQKVDLAKGADWRSPSANYIVGAEDATLYARFALPAEDSLSFDLAETFAEATEVMDDFDRPVLSLTNVLDLAVGFDSLSLPTVTVKGLPSGLSFDKASLKLSGKPKAPGVSKVEMSAKNASGYAFSQVYYVRVENTVSEHVEGYDSEDFVVGAEVEEYLDNYFSIVNTNAALKTVSLTGLPSGLSLVSEKDNGETYYYVEGTPKSAGDFTVVCKAAFSDGTSESASALFTVSEPDPFDYGVDVDFSGLEGRSVGDEILAEDEVVIGEYDGEAKIGVKSVSGLPAGISAKKVESDDGTVLYLLSGTFTKAGEFNVSVKVSYEDWDADSIGTATLSRKVVVADTVWSYVSANLLEEDLSQANCKASGSGVYAAGATAKLSATAGAGYVFAGWCDSAGSPMPAAAQDYRKSSLAVPVSPVAELDWYADFILKDDDYIDMSAFADAEIEIDTAAGEKADFQFFVDSGSLPTLKFDNLPAGIACEPSSEVAGDYVLSYDPSAKKQPAPGRYTVTVTGTNASRMSDSAKFLVTVLNYVDADIHVEKDYGVLVPDVEMTPIPFTNAVDFARGDTLDVSGLPAGLKYDKTTCLLTGVPTKPGSYTLTFKAKIKEEGEPERDGVATAFIAVKDFPTVAAVVDDKALDAGNKVTGTGSFKAGTKVTLKAAAAKGWVFAGWGAGSGVEGLAALNPSLAYVVGTDDLSEVEASFIELRDDELYIDDPGVVAVVKNEAFSTNLVETLTATRSLPSFSVSGLPNGLKFDAKTCLIAGTVAASAKSGYYYATISAKNAGGYTFTRIARFVVLDSPDEEVPDEPALTNGANIDFSALDGLATGDFLPAAGVEAVGFEVGPATNTESGVAAVVVSGLPAGLKADVAVEDGVADVVVHGTPAKPGRYVLKVVVTYADKKKATSEYAVMVADGGSAWLDVVSIDDLLGTASGSGVYASGAVVKLSAKPAAGHVFAGWYEDEDGLMPFDVLAETDGIDYRAAGASFVFRRAMFENDPPVLFAGFVEKSAAADPIAVSGLEDTWEIAPDEDSELQFEVASASLPKLTASGLPKGVAFDAVGGRFVYSSAAKSQIVPGLYTVALKAVNQSNASATEKLTVFVANKTTDAIGGLNPLPDAYPLYAGVALDPELVMPEVDVTNGWKLAAAGLPAGLKLVQDKDTKAYSVQGVAAKAGTNTVTFTATKGSVKEVATITVAVAALPEWAYGTYDGAYFEFEDETTNAVGQVTATVSSAGKVSGKILKGGKQYPFAAASFCGYAAADGVFQAEVVVTWSTADKETFLLSFGPDEDGLGSVFIEPVGEGAHYAEAVQNAWLRKDMSLPAFATGAKQPVLALSQVDSYDLVCKFSAKGAVSVSGKVNGAAATCTAQLLAAVWDDSMVVGAFVVYVKNSGFEGGAYCHVFEVVLRDTDGDGKLDYAAVPEG